MPMRFIKLRRVGTLGFVALLCGARAFAQQQPPPATPLRFEVRAWPAGAVLGAAVVGTLVPELSKRSLPHATCAPCDPSRLWGLDRGILGPVRSGTSALSSATLVGTGVAGGLLLIRSRRGESAEAWREDLAVFAQAVGVASAVTEWTKVLVHRARPVRYGPDGALYDQPSNGLSFPSGHTSAAFAAAAAYASILRRRGIAGRHRSEIAALFTAAAATGVLRVAARKHFPTDVVAGAALGAAIGWAVPAVHAVH
jgi:membrane-associated phospholipid phosphatase